MPHSSSSFALLLVPPSARSWGPWVLAASDRSGSFVEHQAERVTAKISKPFKVIFRFQNRCMWAGEPSLPICSLRCYINVFFFLSLTCIATLPQPACPYLPSHCLCPVTHPSFHPPHSSPGLFFKLTSLSPGEPYGTRIGSRNGDCFQRPSLRWEI